MRYSPMLAKIADNAVAKRVHLPDPKVTVTQFWAMTGDWPILIDPVKETSDRLISIAGGIQTRSPGSMPVPIKVLDSLTTATLTIALLYRRKVERGLTGRGRLLHVGVPPKNSRHLGRGGDTLAALHYA